MPAEEEEGEVEMRVEGGKRRCFAGCMYCSGSERC